MDLRQYLNVCYASMTFGMEKPEREKFDMLLEGRKEAEILAVTNREAMQGLAGYIGQVA